MSEHTRGPWHARKFGEGWFVEAPGKWDLTAVISEADARLISAAPDLLHALQEILLVYEGDDPIADRAYAAIHKATRGLARLWAAAPQ